MFSAHGFSRLGHKIICLEERLLAKERQEEKDKLERKKYILSVLSTAFYAGALVISIIGTFTTRSLFNRQNRPYLEIKDIHSSPSIIQRACNYQYTGISVEIVNTGNLSGSVKKLRFSSSYRQLQKDTTLIFSIMVFPKESERVDLSYDLDEFTRNFVVIVDSIYKATENDYVEHLRFELGIAYVCHELGEEYSSEQSMWKHAPGGWEYVRAIR